MAHATPAIHGDSLVWRDGDELRSITVGSPVWFIWLEQNAKFYFAGTTGTFTARKEMTRQGRSYWKAYRNRSGRLHRAYLGRTGALTMERLADVATELAARGSSDETPSPEAAAGYSVVRQGAAWPGTPGVSNLQLAGQDAGPGVQPDWLLKTKLAVPLVRPALVRRPRLKEQLARVFQHRLTLISAPAGFGKTTLLSQWIESSGCHVAWISLDAGDNDPARFWAYFVAALQTIYPRLGEETLRLLRSSPAALAESLLTTLLNSLTGLPNDLAIVLDDYETIETPGIHEGLGFLLDRLPPQVHLVIASRIDPPLPLARWRARRQLLELRAADLSFTPEETLTFLREVMHLNLPQEEVAALERRTEGWIVGLQLVAFSLQDSDDPHGFIQAFTGDHRHILDYLVEEVLQRQPADVQAFLLETSILERLCGSLCEAVTGQAHGQAMLERLDRANLFTVPLDNKRCWYRYHGLFADALRACLGQARPADVPELHRRASAWYERNRLMGEAVGHALAAAEFDLAARLIEQTATSLLTRCEVTTFLGWINSLPGEQVRGRPRLCLAHAWALTNAGQLEAAEARLRDVERFLSKSAEDHSGYVTVGSDEEITSIQILLDEVNAVRTNIAIIRGDDALGIVLSRQSPEPVGEYDTFLRGAMTQIQASAYWLNGDFARAENMLMEAISLNQASGDIPNMVIALGQLARLQVFQGRLREAARTYRQALLLASDQGSRPNPIARTACIGLGWLLYEWNDLEEATKYVTEGIELAKQAGVTSIMLLGYTALARVKQAQGEHDGAFEVIRQAEQLARANGLTQTLAQLASYRARLWLAQGDLEAAVRWAEASGLHPDDALSYRHEARHMTLARVIAAQGRVDEAVWLLERLLDAAETAGRMGSAIKILVLLASAWRAQGRTASALTALNQALTLAEPEGYVRTFVDAGPPMSSLMSELLRTLRPPFGETDRGFPTYVRELVAAFGGNAELSWSKDSVSVPSEPAGGLISEREVEVLGLLASGCTTSEIAGQLVVARSTVKTHINNLYRKLGVRNRIHAVTRGRELGLLT